MAFQFNRPANNNNANGNNAQGNDAQWKAQAFLNLWVKRADGSRAKIGAIPLREAKNFEKALIERLQKEDGMEALSKALEIDFQMADKPTSAVNLGF